MSFHLLCLWFWLSSYILDYAQSGQASFLCSVYSQAYGVAEESKTICLNFVIKFPKLDKSFSLNTSAGNPQVV